MLDIFLKFLYYFDYFDVWISLNLRLKLEILKQVLLSEECILVVGY